MRKTALLICTLMLSSAFISCSSLRFLGYENGHKYVDLGLSVKWATANIGAVEPQDTGYYFAWGEIEPKELYSWWTYRFHIDGITEDDLVFSKYVRDSTYGVVDDKYTLDPEDDAAHVNWGGRWRIPTSDELDELMDERYCTWTWTTIKGVQGYKIQSKKKGYKRRYIFLPAVEHRAFPESPEDCISCSYWSSTPMENCWACVAHLLSFDYSWGGCMRFLGLPIRPVCPK